MTVLEIWRNETNDIVEAISRAKITRRDFDLIIAAAMARRREFCVHGHDLTGPRADVRIRVIRGLTQRVCRHCERDRDSGKRPVPLGQRLCTCKHIRSVHTKGECYHKDDSGAFDCECTTFEESK